VLLVLVKKVVKNFLIQQGNTFKIVSGPGLEADNLIDETVGLMAQVCDVLLSLNFLLHICRIVTDLKFDSVKRWRIYLLQALYRLFDQ
jgi:hypothetical protein